MAENEPGGASDEVVGDQVQEIGQNQDPAEEKEGNESPTILGDWNAHVIERNSDGRREEFWVGGDGAVWHRWESSPNSGFNSGDHSLGGHVTSGVGVTNNADGRLEIFGRADGGDLSHKWQLTAGGWSDWASLGGLLQPFTGVYADPFDARIRVKVTGVDGLLHYKWQAAPNCCWEDIWR